MGYLDKLSLSYSGYLLDQQFQMIDGLRQADRSNGHDSLCSKNGYPTGHPVRLPIVEHVGAHRLDGAEVRPLVRYD